MPYKKGIVVKGVQYSSYSDACRAYGLPYQTVYVRAKRTGLTIEQALNQLDFYPRPLVIGRVSFEYVNKKGKKIICNGLHALREVLFEDYACDRCPPEHVEAKAWITLSERITKPGKQYRESVCD